MASSLASIEASSPSLALRIGCVAAVALVRLAVGTQPHSGQDNYHGSAVAYGGDYEAQRHWMEVTVHLPVGEWYYYDVDYWGLDYPPLSAYQSWLCGKLSQLMVGQASVALVTSRGYEDPTHKAFLRASVVLLDLVCYGTAAWRLTRPAARHSQASLMMFAQVMLQPSILLIDHGHFQYNTVALGLSLWSFYCCTHPASVRNWLWPMLGAVCLCGALSFKQMTLYYAPAIFAYLLGRCVPHGLATTTGVRPSGTTAHGLRRFLLLGVTVVVTFGLLWWPFVVYGPAATSGADRLLHVLRRIFPFQRGLFEGKVANLWCVLSLQPVRIRDRLPARFQPLAALSVTLVLIMPACVKLFWIGRQEAAAGGQQSTLSPQHRRALLWGVTNTALAFFLASFQVHEKSLLLAVAPASLLAFESPAWSHWFVLVATWTLWPLLVLDRLQVAYVCVLTLFGVALWVIRDTQVMTSTTSVDHGIFSQHVIFRVLAYLSLAVMLALHALEVCVTPPDGMPDIFPVLWSVVGCGMLLLAWATTVWELYRNTDHYATAGKEKQA
jgi:alpha-1,3-glucosyltransferase